jgi:hypothetical protein
MKAFLAGLALATMLLASVASAAGNAQRTRVIHTKAIIESFALGGDRLAYDLRGFTSCNRVLVLNLRTNKTSRVSGKQTCNADITSTGHGVRELAVARTRLAWIINQGGNTESDDYLYIVSLPRPKERRLASAMRFGEPGGRQAGKWIGNLVASGNLLAVNRWTTNQDGATTSSGVDRIVGNRLRRIVSSRKAILGQAADNGRIAVLYEDSTVELYNANGARLRTVKVTSGTEIALRGDNLLVLTETRTLELYSARTGALVRTWPLLALAPGELDTFGGLAIYVAHPKYTVESFKVHALNLRTGKDVVVASGNWQLRQSAELDAAGLLYARDRHNLVLVPFKQVLAAVS